MILQFVVISASILSGINAGLFYAWSISVTPGIKMVNETHYLTTFQAMNRAILNPIFYSVFFGSAILCILLMVMTYTNSSIEIFATATLASLLYLIGVFAVTAFGNVPLNETLDKVDLLHMSAKEKVQFRAAYEAKWNRLNHFRTIASILSFITLVYLTVLID